MPLILAAESLRSALFLNFGLAIWALLCCRAAVSLGIGLFPRPRSRFSGLKADGLTGGLPNAGLLFSISSGGMLLDGMLARAAPPLSLPALSPLFALRIADAKALTIEDRFCMETPNKDGSYYARLR